MGCKDPVVPEPLLKNITINCLTFAEKTRQPHSNNRCLFWSLAVHLPRNQRLEKEASKFFASVMSRMERFSHSQFHGVHMNDYPIVEALLIIDSLRSDINNVEGNSKRELVWRSVQKQENNVRVLRHNNPICYMSNINAVFQSFRCPNFDTFFNRTSNLEQFLTTCSERVKNDYPRNIYQIRETLFDKLDCFGIKYTSEQKLLKNLAVLTLNRFVSKWRLSETPRQQPG